MTKYLMLIGFAWLAAGAGASAQDDRQALAEAVIAESGAAEVMMATVESSGPLIISAVRSNVPDLTDLEGDLILGYFLAEVELLLPEFSAEVSRIYAERFTAEELQALLDFYRSPVGQTFLAAQPELAAEGQVLGERLGREAMQNALPHIEDLMANR